MSIALLHIEPPYVTFDVNNEQHLAAFVCLVKHGRQHPELRFELEHPYTNVVTMMLGKIAEAHIVQHKSCKKILETAQAAVTVS